MCAFTCLSGDCLDLLPSLLSGSVDAVLVDPPFGTTASKWDIVIPFEPMWKELLRVTKKNAAIVFCCDQPFTSLLVASNPKDFRYTMVWPKTNPTGFLDAKRRPLKGYEELAVFYRKLPTYNPQKTQGKPNHARKPREGDQRKMWGEDGAVYQGEYGRLASDESGMKYPTTLLPVFPRNPANGRLHPNEKPVELLRWLVRTYSNPDDTVLDFAMGSGTTGVACGEEGRSFVGIELSEQYVRVARERIADAYKNQEGKGG